MEHTFWSLLPPLLTVALAIVTRRVLLALGAGILSAALLLAGGDPGMTLQKVLGTFTAVFWTPGENGAAGELNIWSLSVLGFLLLLGILTALVTLTGGARAFGEWALRRVRSRRAAGVLAAALGVVIFIDDYFNALVVGQVARPVTDRHQISRAKLAYLIDSTAAPVCVVSPISSWGAYIIALLGSVLAAEGITGGQSALRTFLQTIPQNFYVWAALGLVAITVWTGRDFGPMRRYEAEALGELPAGSVTGGMAPGELSAALPVSERGRTGDLLWPIGVLILATVGVMFWSGAAAYRAETGQAPTLLQMLEHTNVAESLVWGGALGVLTALWRWAAHWRSGALTPASLGLGVWEGLRAMFPAVVVLVLAWMTTDLIGQLGTGDYLAGLVQASLPAAI
ncbi:MAG: Na+/H+ antiporter NhaC family protein, partial [Deinococcus sp.]|nr:Na+/H+ antiporter NhaC family protein [Deinococcus sp.]